jgi:hypothetical protein
MILRVLIFDKFGKKTSIPVKAMAKRNAITPIAVPKPQAFEPL